MSDGKIVEDECVQGRWTDLRIEARGRIGAFASEERPGKVCAWIEFAGDNIEVFITPDEARRLATVFLNASEAVALTTDDSGASSPPVSASPGESQGTTT